MSELKTYKMVDENYCDDCVCVIPSEVYLKSEADKVIAEKDKEIAELKAKLEDVQASAYAESVDAGMRERRLRRTLWIARAERALAERRRYCAMSAFKDVENDALRIKWCIIQRKCRAKAEEYR